MLRQTLLILLLWIVCTVTWIVFEGNEDMNFLKLERNVEPGHVVLSILLVGVLVLECSVWAPHATSRFRVMRQIMQTCLTPFFLHTYEQSYIGNILTSMTKFLTASEIAMCFTVMGGISPFAFNDNAH